MGDKDKAVLILSMALLLVSFVFFFFFEVFFSHPFPIGLKSRCLFFVVFKNEVHLHDNSVSHLMVRLTDGSICHI